MSSVPHYAATQAPVASPYVAQHFGRGFALWQFFVWVTICFGTYLLAVRLQVAQEFEEIVLKEADFSVDPALPLAAVEPAVIAFVMIAVTLLSWRLFGATRAIFQWFLAGTALLLAQIFKMFLPRQNLLLAETVSVENTLPSGHMATFMTLGVMLVVAAPAAGKLFTYWFTATLSAAAAWQLLDYSWHRPSDLIAAVALVTTVYAFAALVAPRAFVMSPSKSFLKTFNVLGILFAFGFLLQFVWHLGEALLETRFATAVSYAVVTVVILLATRAISRFR